MKIQFRKAGAKKIFQDIWILFLIFLLLFPSLSKKRLRQFSKDWTYFHQRRLCRRLSKEFFRRYGGEEKSLTLLSKGIESLGNPYGKDIMRMSERILNAKAMRRDFVIVFNSDSYSKIEGNKNKKSYPLVLESILKPLMKRMFNVKLVMKTISMEEMREFPRGWCLSNFFDTPVDVLAWDFGIDFVENFEAFLRNTMQLNKITGGIAPMFIMFDQNPRNRYVLEEYVRLDYLDDPIVISRRDSIDHELAGWMISMHLFKGIQLASEEMRVLGDWRTTHKKLYEKPNLPRPISNKGNQSSMLSGVPAVNNKDWIMNQISCRMNDERSRTGLLDEIIASGHIVSKDTSSNISDEDYKNRWINLSMKLNDFGLNRKTSSLHGLSRSGIIHFFLPYEYQYREDETFKKKLKSNQEISDASGWISWIVFCEKTGKHNSMNRCDLENDLDFVVGGVEAFAGKLFPPSQFQEEFCILVKVPESAKMNQKENAKEGRNIGLDVYISVKNSELTHMDGVCSIATVIWENIPKRSYF